MPLPPSGGGRENGRGCGDDVHFFMTGVAAEVCEFLEANGALNARLLQLTYAGMASGMTALTWEVENMQAQANLGSAWFSDAGLALQARTNGANPASMPISSALYNRIPL